MVVEKMAFLLKSHNLEQEHELSAITIFNSTFLDSLFGQPYQQQHRSSAFYNSSIVQHFMKKQMHFLFLAQMKHETACEQNIPQNSDFSLPQDEVDIQTYNTYQPGSLWFSNGPDKPGVPSLLCLRAKKQFVYYFLFLSFFFLFFFFFFFLAFL